MKIKRLIAGLLISVMLGNQLAYFDLSPFSVPKAYAQSRVKGAVSLKTDASGNPESKLGIVVILVESDLLDDKKTYDSEGDKMTLRERIFAYAENVQKRMPHTRAIVMGVNPDESTYKISTVLEKMYHEGVDNDLLDESKINDDYKKEDDNQLSGVVVVGDVPVPVVYDKDGATSPSLYPYTDFYRKRYIYNHETDHFELNKSVANPNPDIWHGVIKPPSHEESERRQQLADYFYKNNQYSNGLGGYADFNKRLLYYNFPAVERKLNTLDYSNYKRYIKLIEETAFGRFNRHLLKEVVSGIAEEMEPDKAPSERTPLIDDASIEIMSDSSTEFMIKKFTKTFAGSLQTYIGRLKPVIESTGRWGADEYDNLASLITMRDVYMQTTLLGKAVQLENRINAEIEIAQQDVSILDKVSISILQAPGRIKPLELYAFSDGLRFNSSDRAPGIAPSGSAHTNPPYVHYGYTSSPPTAARGISSAAQCGLLRGQKRPDGVPVFENNSVLVEANHTYNPTGAAKEPDDDDRKTKKSYPYNVMGGCVANNSIRNTIEYEFDGDPQRETVGPQFCNPRSAINPVFDLAGSKEVDFKFYDSEAPAPNSPFGGPLGNQCEIENISYNPNWIFPEGHYWDYEEFFTDYKTPLREDAWCHSGTLNPCFEALSGLKNPFNGNFKTWSQMITRLFADMESKGEIVFDKTNPNWISEYTSISAKPHLQLDKIMTAVFNPNLLNDRILPIKTVSYYYNSYGNNITFSFQPHYKTISGVIEHREPSLKTLSDEQKFMTPNRPADGIRYTEWHKGNGEWNYYQYPNLFRVEGHSLETVTANLAQMIQSKDAELNRLLGEEKNLVKKFFLQNADLVEPILWRQMTIDQKHQMVLEKYLNADSLLPTPDPFAIPPLARPVGYEVMHVVGNGDVHGFEFGINKSRLSDADLNDSELSDAEAEGDEDGDNEEDDESADEGGGEACVNPKTLWEEAEAKAAGKEICPFSCGPADGVEIWEWFDAVICWIEEEISQLDQAVSLDDSCSGAIVDPEVEDDPDLAGVNITLDTELAVNNPATTPVALTVHIPKKTMVVGEQAVANITVLNNKAKPIIGYLDDPLKIKAEGIGLTFDQDEIMIFTGEAKVNITATGVSEGMFEASLGEIKKTVPIRVTEGINVLLNYERETETDRPAYNISATLVENDGTRVTDVDTSIRLSTLNPMDGLFVSSLLQLNDGIGETLFFPNPTTTRIEISSTHPVYGGIPISVPPIIGDPFKIIIEAPKGLQIGKVARIPVTIVDSSNILTNTFNEPIQVKVSEKFKKYAEVVSETININNGRGVIRLDVKGETGQVNLIADHDDLRPGTASIPVIARVDKEEWSKMSSQNLFASFVGFPAANFLEEDYFGGVHLFNGKTQAVFGFTESATPPPLLSIQPNYYVQTTLPQQQVKVQSLSDKLSLQIINSQTLESLLSTIIPLNFENVTLWDGESDMEEGTLYLEPTNEEDYAFNSEEGVVDIKDSNGDLVFVADKEHFHFHQLEYELFHESEGFVPALELIIANAKGEVGRLYLNFEPHHLNPSNFTTGKSGALKRIYAGKSTADPTGLVYFDPNGEIDEKLIPKENFGFEQENKYILRFAGGSPVGEAVQYNLPYNAVLLGDPTIRLNNKSVSSLNYDSTIGRQIFQDPEGSDIIALTHFDFNHDNIQDAAVVMKDGRIRLFEGGATEPLYRDRGDIAYLADGTLDIIAFDFKNDGYEDLLVATREGRLAILHNDGEVITRTDQKIKVGKQLYQIQKADMDMDGDPDLVTLDSRGDIRIFYNQSSLFGERPVPVSKQIQENGMLIGNYGFSIQKGQNLQRDLKIRYPGMPEPEGAPVPTPGVTDEPAQSPEPSEDNPYGLPSFEKPEDPDLSALADFADRDTSGDVSESEAERHVQGLRDATQSGASGEGAPDIPLLPWKEGDLSEVYFAPAEDFTAYSAAFNNGLFLTVSKKVINLDRPEATDLDLEEPLLYTIDLVANKNVNDFVLSDVVPDALTFNEDSVQCAGDGCETMQSEFKSIYLFVSKLNLKANSPITITYEVTVKHTPKAAVMLKRMDGSVALNRSDIPLDAYMDILVSPPYNNTGQLMLHYTKSRRTYNLTTTKKEENADIGNAIADVSECNEWAASLGALQGKEELSAAEQANVENFMETCLGSAKDAVQNGETDPSNPPTPSPEECAANPEACAGGVMDSMMEGLSDLSCMGGGCFPMPYNMAFLAPQSIPMAMPVLSFPTTLTTPVGVFPVPGTMAMLPMPLGHTDAPGTYNSLIRLYLIPTLTGGVGVGLCWGPYMGSAPVPPPLIPIPYPPPIGNCMTLALPMGANPICGAIEDGITAMMEGANSLISDANSGIAAVNNGGIPAEIDQGDEQGGAGGLEVSLALNLGEAQKFEPPTKGFSNTHIGGFDSIGGVIAGWLDSQLLEIMNKLLTMPTIRVILPDVPRIFASDWDEFGKLINAWWNNLSGTAKSTATNIIEEDQTAFDPNQDSSVGWIQNYAAVEKEIKAFNTNIFEDLYGAFSAIPFIKINEHNIDFKIPYISYAQLNQVIRDYNKILNYYERQIQKWNDTIETYACPDEPDEEVDDCIAIQILEIFVADFEPFIASIQENIEVLQSYLTFPRDFILLKKQLANYIRTLSCWLDTFTQMLGGWLITIQNQIIGYIEVYFTIIEVMKNVEDLMDIFINFEDNCDICTNERFGNFGWFSLLGLVLPEIPIVKFPKWPDIVVDFSDLKGQISLEVPTIHFVLEPVKLPTLPLIPLPDIPNINDLELLLQLPELPVLPQLPELPELPELPAVPVINLPTLPPPPKLPDLGASIGKIIPILETILNIWCMIKKSFSPVPEAYLQDHIVLQTNRPSYMIPLDMLKPKIGDIGALQTDFNELVIETKVHLGIRIAGALEAVDKAAKDWNDKPIDLSKWFDEQIAKAQKAAMDASNALSDISSKIGDLDTIIEDAWEESVQKAFDDLGDKMEEFDEEYFRSAEDSMQQLSDDATEAMGEWSKEANQKLTNAVESIDGALDGFQAAAIQAVKSEIGRLIIRLMISPELALAEWGMKEIIVVLEENGINPDSIQSELDNLDKSVEDWYKCVSSGECPAEDEGSQALLPIKQENAIAKKVQSEFNSRFGQLAEVIKKTNENPVDYTVLKEKYNIPDYRMIKRMTAVDKIEAMRDELLDYSYQLELDIIEVDESDNAFAVVQKQVDAPLPFSFAKNTSNPEDRTVFSSVVESKRLAQVPTNVRQPKRQASSTKSTPKASGSSGRCIGSCLVDPVTNQSVQFIPYVDNPAITKTGFIPAAPGESHVVYSDGSSLYLKENLAVPANITSNKPPRVPNIIFDLDHFITINNYVMPLKEAVNMLSVTLTENSAANFAWLPSTHPDLYGYGIELERSILGFDATNQSSPLPDVTIVLLPPNEDGSKPSAIARGVEIPYGTLITSIDDKEQAREKFGIPAKAFMLGAEKIEFETIGGVTMSLNENRAVYFDVYDGPAYRINMDNGFYHIRMTWFDQWGRIANYNHAELLSPQIYVDAPPPIDIRFENEFLFPVYKEGVINASDIFTDLSGTLSYYWDANNDGLPEATGESFTIGPQNEPKELEITVIASVDLADEGFDEYKKKIKIIIYPPELFLEETPLIDNSEANGFMKPLQPTHDLTDMPFSLFRKRWGTWKNLGLLKQKDNLLTNPPLSDKNNYKDNYYAISGGGDYSIADLTSGPSNVLASDSTQKDVVRVHYGTGQVEVLDLEYELKAIPASRELPTRISAVKKGFDTVLTNIYYVSDENTDVEILEEPLHQQNIGRIGVTIGDRNTNDVIIARNIPGHAESYPGGAAIFNDQTQINVALINSDGAIRMMQTGYSLRIKNEGQLSEKIIFEIINRSGQPVFDVFIAADFKNLNIRQDEIWDEIKATIGYLQESIQPIFASLFAQSKPQIPKPAVPESPFEDLDSSHPYFQQILDLYKRRIVTGYEDGGFRPDAKLTRAEFVKIALGSTKCFDCTHPTDAQVARYQSTRPFPDVSLPAWYHYCIAIAKELGMITGYGDGFFRPGQNISRAEAVAVLLRQSEIELLEAPEEYFQDVPDYAWYVDYVYTAVEAGLIQNNAGFVLPDEEITRGEFAFMASGVLQIQDCRLVDSDGDGIPDWWEMENNLDPLFAGDALYDVDDDFCTSLEEFQAGSDPNDAASACRVECLCLDNPNQNDTDKDGIIDPCDEDLDDDGVTNVVCMFDENGLIDPILAAGSEDNCIFNENPDQIDYDQDKTGDICLPLDQCPEIPEDLDGYHDLDGCPEVFDDTADNPLGVYVNKGPACYFLDWEKDLVKGDVIMTAIIDVITHDVIYSQSNEVTY